MKYPMTNGTALCVFDSSSFSCAGVRPGSALDYLKAERRKAGEFLQECMVNCLVRQVDDRDFSHLFFREDGADLVIDALFAGPLEREEQALVSARIPKRILVPAVRQLHDIVAGERIAVRRSEWSASLIQAFQVDYTRRSAHTAIFLALQNACDEREADIRFRENCSGDSQRALAGALALHIVPPKFLTGLAPEIDRDFGLEGQ